MNLHSYTVLARRHRPLTFRQVRGQEHVTGTLKTAISTGRLSHAFLFAGPRGTGKTTVARILARALNCTGRPEGLVEPCNGCERCRARRVRRAHEAQVGA